MAKPVPEPFRAARRRRRPGRPARAARAHPLAGRDSRLRLGLRHEPATICAGSWSTGATASTGARRRPSSTRSTQFTRRRSAASTCTSSTSPASARIRCPLAARARLARLGLGVPRADPAADRPGPLRRRPRRRLHGRRAVAARLHALVHARPAALRRRRDRGRVRRADDRRARLPALRGAGRRLGRLRRRRARRAPSPSKVCGIHLNFLPLRADIPFPDEPTEKDRIYQSELGTGRARRPAITRSRAPSRRRSPTR